MVSASCLKQADVQLPVASVISTALWCLQAGHAYRASTTQWHKSKHTQSGGGELCTILRCLRTHGSFSTSTTLPRFEAQSAHAPHKPPEQSHPEYCSCSQSRESPDMMLARHIEEPHFTLPRIPAGRNMQRSILKGPDWKGPDWLARCNSSKSLLTCCANSSTRASFASPCAS